MSDDEQVVEDFEALSAKKQRKRRYKKALIECLDEYKNVLVINVDNVGSKQMQSVRMTLRGRARMLMGKNTIIRKVLRDLIPDRPKLELLIPYVQGNMGFVFSNEDLQGIRTEIVQDKVPAAARSGAIAPIDVIVPPGPTGLDPGQTNFFQALNIATKIAKGSIEILTKVHLIKAGDKISASAVSLLGKLGVKPFFFGITVRGVYEDGDVYDPAIWDLTDNILFNKWYKGVTHVAALSLVLGMPTKASVGHSLKNAFKKMLAIACETDFTFPMYAKFKGEESDSDDDEDEDEDEDEEEDEDDDDDDDEE